MKNSTALVIGSAITMLFIGTVNATEKNSEQRKSQGRKGAGLEELKSCHKEQQEVRKEYKESRREENQAFHETLKGKEANEVLAAVISRRKSQYSETRTFFNGLYTKFVAQAKDIMAKNEVPAEKQAEVLKKIEERRTEGVAKHEETQNKLIAALEGLNGNDDLTVEQIKNTVSSILPKHSGKSEKSGKKERKGGKGNNKQE
jgi:hypothetical protein